MLYCPHIKRALDIMLSTTALVLLLPIFGFILVLIKIDSEGPVFFKQNRLGKGMKIFKLIKFRSMTNRLQDSYDQFNPGDACQVTTVGALLRKTKLDELPELLNILKGDMSIVGPRPEVPKYVQMFSEKYKEILSVRPGLSDNASIKYRNEEEMLAAQENPEAWYCDVILPDKLKLAQMYVRKITFKGDTKIVCRTIKSLFSSKYITKSQRH